MTSDIRNDCEARAGLSNALQPIQAWWRLTQTPLFIRKDVMLRLLGWIGRECGRSARVLSSGKLTPATQRQR